MENTLVSICVLAYNSEETIIETLESIYSQTYRNIELIISDDGSKDSTVKIAETWIQNHKNRFVNTYILTVFKNMGVPSNCNRAVAVCNGKWIKLIAADDCLLPNCIKDNIDFVITNPEILISYSRYYGFESIAGQIRTYENILKSSFYNEFDTEPKKQLKIYIIRGYNIIPTLFVAKKIINKVGGFIEKYKLFEDTPFITKVLSYNVKIHHLPKYTVLYRINNDSITKANTKTYFFNISFERTKFQFHKDMVYPLFHWYELSFWIKEISFILLYYFTIKILKNKQSQLTKCMYYFFKMLNPYYLFTGIQNKISKRSKYEISQNI